jgi:hypothetical protein
VRADIAALVNALETVRRNYPWEDSLPPGAKMRMHPGVPYILHKDPDLAFWGDDPLGALNSLNKLPVIFDATMELGTWELVLGTGKVDLWPGLP